MLPVGIIFTVHLYMLDRIFGDMQIHLKHCEKVEMLVSLLYKLNVLGPEQITKLYWLTSDEEMLRT